MNAKILGVGRDWSAVTASQPSNTLATVTPLAGRAPSNRPHVRNLEGNDAAAYDRFVARIRSLTDSELANEFHISDPSVIAMLRELAS